MNIICVEPHADDAFLSAHGHILQWVKQGHSVTIVTMSGKPRRMAEAKRYADNVGAQWLKE
jgi:LmbE family N-acetylglucosaminyl deacetylase